MSYKVLIADKMSARAEGVFQKNSVQVDVKTGLSPAELIGIIGQYDGLVIRSTTKVTAEVLEAANKLQVIGRAGIGVDTVDVAEATRKGVIVMNTPHGNATTTAEHAIAMMFALARRIPQANQSTHEGKWEKSKFMGTEVTGKTLGIIGCGNIGAIVANRALGLQMRVVAYDPFLSEERAKSLGIEKLPLDTVLENSDFVTLHTPLTEKTRNLLGEAQLARMKKGAFLINCARGGLIDEVALKTSLEQGHLAGAALDVFSVEPARENILFGMEQVVCTPHLGASTHEAQEIVASQISEQICDFFLTGAVKNAVNMPSISAQDAPILRPYITLVEQIGHFSGQLVSSPIKSVEVIYDGSLSERNVAPLSSAACVGLLKPALGDGINMVNAAVMLEQRGIGFSEVKRKKTGLYDNYIMIKLQTEDGKTFSVAGSIFSDGKPRLIRIDGVRLEAEFAPFMLFTRNMDTPGYVGALGQLLGDLQINIASFYLGRQEDVEQAVALLHLDSALDEKVLQQIQELPHVVEACFMTLCLS